MNRVLPDAATFGKLVAQAQDAGRDVVIPVVLELDAASLRARGIDPLAAFELLAGDAAHAALLETAEAGSGDADISIVAGTARSVITGADALERVRRLVVDEVATIGIELPRFVGGAIGMLAHEFATVLEPTVPRAARPASVPVPDAMFLDVDEVVVFEHARDRVLAIITLRSADIVHAGRDHAAAVERLHRIEHQLDVERDVAPNGSDAAISTLAPSTNIDADAFEAIVADAVELVRSGEVVQVVVSRRFDVPFEGSPVEAYRAIRRLAPAPYHALLRMDDVHVVGASPEQLVGVADGRVVTHPIAGTRPRGVDDADDARMEAELTSCRKERAEHMMLVDLGRNDVGRTCVPGSVEVTRLATIERYSHVMHLVSRVEGRLADGRHPVDALAACFPAGTLTGAPKVRALQLIAELEADRRGAYGGVVGYLGHGRVLDAAITIRTAVLADGVASVQAGAGIVARSVPRLERLETEHKARAVLAALASVVPAPVEVGA